MESLKDQYIKYEQFLKLENCKCVININDQFLNVKGKTINAIMNKVKKLANIDLRGKHSRQIIYSEFRPHAWGIFFWLNATGKCVAFIECEYV